MIQGIIYCAISPSNKKYFGKTIYSLKRRMNQHKNSAINNKPQYFYNAIRKYGFEQFKWNIIETIQADTKNDLVNKLNEKEIYWIKTEKTNEREYGYNSSKGGDGGDFNSGKKHTEKTKQKMSNSHKGKTFTDNHKFNLSKSIKISITEEERKKRSIRASGINNPMYGKKSIMNGIKVSQQTKENIRKGTLLAMQRPEVKEKLKNKKLMFGESNGMFGQNHTEKTKEQISKNIKATPKKECIYCHKEFYPWHYSRSHGEKCKNKNI